MRLSTPLEIFMWITKNNRNDQVFKQKSKIFGNFRFLTGLKFLPHSSASRRILRGLLVSVLIIGWIFSGWPEVLNTSTLFRTGFPPRIQQVRAATAGPSFPTSGVNDTSIGVTAWTAPGNVTASDNTSATVALAKNTGVSQAIKATGFGFSIPADAWIDGITVEWEKSDDLDGGAGETRDNAVRIVKNGTIGATDNSNVSNWTITDTFVSYGGVSNLWGETWTATDINSSTFGAAISGKNVKISGGGAATTGSVDSVRITVTYTLPTYTQSAYKLFNNLDSTDVGTSLAVQDTAATLGSTGVAFRLRMLLHIGAAQLGISGQAFKLQFVGKGTGTCAAPTGGTPASYTDVAPTTVIAYKDNATPADGATLTANANDPTHGADATSTQTYEELNNFTNTVAAIPAGQDGEWDFSLFDNGAAASTAYCFRVVKSDGAVINTYSVIPEITTAAFVSISVSVSDGVITYGTMVAGTSTTTINLTDTQTLTNDGNVTEIFNIMGQNTACPWTLAATAGTDQYVHEFCKKTDVSCASPPTNYTALTTGYQTLYTGVAASTTRQLDLRLTVPTTSTCFTSQAVDVTIQATQ